VAGSPSLAALDANVIVRYVLRDNPDLYSKARSILTAVHDGGEVLVDPVVLSEVVFVLQKLYKRPNGEIAEGLLSLLQYETVTVPNKPHYLHALQLFAAGVPHFGDACICAAALESCEGRLYSFDRALSSVPGIHRSERPFK
jgi:predicted nucleic acid-binding protein